MSKGIDIAHPTDGRPTSALLPAVLARVAVSDRIYRQAIERADILASDAASELIAARAVREEDLSRAIADALNVPYGLPGPQDRLVSPATKEDTRHLRTCTTGLQSRLFIAPPLETLDRTAHWITERGDGRIVVSTRTALRDHAARHTMDERLHDARFFLAARRPEWSARTVLSATQGYWLGIATCVLAFAMLLFGTAFWNGAHVVFAFFFACCTLFRLLVLVRFDRGAREDAEQRARRENALRLPVGRLPVYTILVALYHEREMVGPLVDALDRLNWPRSRRDIKLVCEADDDATMAAVKTAIEGRAGFELVRVPPGAPRTKPKALNHALPLSRGEFLALYDAEDRPDPDQLLEAWLAFSAAERDLACVQAPLVVRNGSQNWLAGIFALEYAVLFRALLPFLARRSLPIPLGGTSNHFRRDVLVELGGWDSHNVAEDADLGIRLSRQGYRTDVIAAPTSEIAPVRWRDWHKQRSRWVKGWIQTYLVHMRRPVATLRELGFTNMLAFQALFISMVAGALMHTAFLVYLAVVAGRMAFGLSTAIAPGWLLAIDVFNILAAGAVFSLLALKVARSQERPLLRYLCLLWLYWLLVSVASMRSVRQLVLDPHRWEKTPHHELPAARTAEVSTKGTAPALAGATASLSR